MFLLGLLICIEVEDVRGFDDCIGNSGILEYLEESGDDESDESDDEGVRKVFKLVFLVVVLIFIEVKSRSGGIDEFFVVEIDEIWIKKKVSINIDFLFCVIRFSFIREVILVF